MSPFQVRFSSTAQDLVRLADAWWTVHREKAPGLFTEELAAVVERLTAMPLTGESYRESRGQEVRRMLMRKTRYHVYYVVDDNRNLVEVVSIWHSTKGRGPDLG